MKNFRMYWPVKPLKVNQYFGGNAGTYKQFGLDGHNGLDLDAIHGQPVYAAHDGICYPEIDSSGGNGVVLRTEEEYEYGGRTVHFKSIYWHLENAYAVVKLGQRVKAGDLIGYADSTGFSTGDHLHFGLKPQEWNESDWTWYNVAQTNGFLGAVDPLPFMNGYFAEDISKLITLWSHVKDLANQILLLYAKKK